MWNMVSLVHLVFYCGVSWRKLGSWSNYSTMPQQYVHRHHNFMVQSNRISKSQREMELSLVAESKQTQAPPLINEEHCQSAVWVCEADVWSWTSGALIVEFLSLQEFSWYTSSCYTALNDSIDENMNSPEARHRRTQTRYQWHYSETAWSCSVDKWETDFLDSDFLVDLLHQSKLGYIS